MSKEEGVVIALPVHGVLTLFYFEENNPTKEKQEAVRKSKEALEDAMNYGRKRGLNNYMR